MSEERVVTNMAKMVYILYLVSLVFGITSVVAVVIAYVNRNDAPAWLRSHYDFQIRTFWISIPFLLIGGLLSLILIGWLIILLWVVWLAVRCVKGLQVLERSQAHPDPESWGF